MCPIDLTEEEKAVLEEEQKPVLQEKEEGLSAEETAEANHLDAKADLEEPEFEGVDKVEDIPKGKEKSYGI